jgi:hypothetical protein
MDLEEAEIRGVDSRDIHSVPHGAIWLHNLAL